MPDLELLFDTHTHSSISRGSGIIQGNKLHIPENHYFSLGIHPKDAVDKAVDLQFLFELSTHPNFIAIGEIGLDNRYENTQFQENYFINQLKIAAEIDKPVILHCVNQWDRCRYLHQLYAPNVSLIYHGYNKVSILDSVILYPKAYFSIGASVLTNHSLQKKLGLIPLNRLLVETDSSEVQLVDVYQCIAENLSLPLHAFMEQIHTNANKVFKL